MITLGLSRVRRPTISAAWLTALIGWLIPAALVAQDPPADSVSISAEIEMPEGLPAPSIDPFDGALPLQAHRLRGLTAEVASLVLQSEVGGDIAIEALATPLRGAEGRTRVPLFVEIDGPTFLQSNQSSTARVEIYAYALSSSQQVAGYLAEAFAVDIQELGEAIWQSGLKYYGHLDLPAGDYRLRILIRNYQSKAVGIRELALSVPADDGLEQQPFLVSPLFSPPPARDAWLPVREWEDSGPYPFVSAQRAISPTVRPVLVAGRQSQAHLFARGLPSGPVLGRIELLQDGRVIAQAPLQDRSRSSGGGLEALEIEFVAPPVEPGVYSLRLALANGAVSPTTTVVVLSRNTGDRGILWSDLRGRLRSATRSDDAGAAAASTPVEAEKKISQAEKREEERHLQELASKYREALAALAESQRDAARLALLELESGVLTDGSLPALHTAELLVAGKMAEHDLECLIPILALHDDLYQTYRQRRLYSLASYSRTMIETLAELYAERGESQGSRIVAARALASLGGHLQEANLPSSSRRLYERALVHDPNNRAALLGLATSFERYGEYSQAVEVLEKLALAHPTFGEGLLRLAINLERIGARPRARELTRQVLALDAPEWVHSLAAQKLARGFLEAGDFEQAAQILESSLEEIPQQHGTMFLLAHVYDRRREALRALALLQAITPQAASLESPRKQYDNWPRDVLNAMRDELREAAAVRRPLIARALAAFAGAGQ